MTALRGAPILALALMLGAPAAAQTPDPGCTMALPVLANLFPGIQSGATAITCPDSGSSTTHVVRVDLTTPGLSFVTSGQGSAGPGTFDLELTTHFLLRTNSQVAINANLFTGCCTDTTPTNPSIQLRGLEISGGKMLSPVQNNPYPQQDLPFDASLLVTAGGLRIVQISAEQIVPDAIAAVTGSHMLMRGGANVAPTTPSGGEFFGPNARTLVGLTADRRILWIAAVDRSTSSGVTLPQAAQLMQKLGAFDALNLDGGGSTSLAVDAGPGQVRLLNTPNDPPPKNGPHCTSPINGHCERYVGAILGIKVSPLPSPAR
jgi:hypothetical protein